ncbi:MAG TPA: hypothetical protein VGC09_12095 [Rhodopila sp.]
MFIFRETAVRLPLIVLVFVLAAVPAFARPDSTDRGPIATDRESAGWADWEVQARMADGDYDGAVQAEQQAANERHDAGQAATDHRPAKR